MHYKKSIGEKILDGILALFVIAVLVITLYPLIYVVSMSISNPLAAVEPCELVPLNFYISQLPDVHFRNRLTVNQRKEDGRIYALSDHTLKIHSPTGVAEFTLRGKDVLLALLREDFGMDIIGLKLRKKF